MIQPLDETGGTLTEVLLQNDGQNGETSIAQVVSISDAGLKVLWYQPGGRRGGAGQLPGSGSERL